MEYRTLGATGTAVSTIALGTMDFGSLTAEKEAHAILDAFLEAGGNLIDTSNVYNDGLVEEILGRWFADRPKDLTERVVLATKGRFSHAADVNAAGLSRRSLTRALDGSLRRLGRDRVDLYQLHAWDPITLIEEALSFLDDTVHAGKVSYVGLSNFTGWQLQLTLSTAQRMGVTLPVTLQQQYACCCGRANGRSFRLRCTTPSVFVVVAAGGRVPLRKIPTRHGPPAATPAPDLPTRCTSGSRRSTRTRIATGP
jgi:aryl-alcohol dehydrogenase-like predicted oxidoreductase